MFCTLIESLTDFRYLDLILVVFGGGDGLMGLARTALPSIESVAVENENIVQVNNIDTQEMFLENYQRLYDICIVSALNDKYFCTLLGQRKSSYGLSSSYVPKCSTCSTK